MQTVVSDNKRTSSAFLQLGVGIKFPGRRGAVSKPLAPPLGAEEPLRKRSPALQSCCGGSQSHLLDSSCQCAADLPPRDSL